MGKIKYTWRDLVCVNGQVFAEEFPIDGMEPDSNIANCDAFFEAVEKKYGTDDFTTYMFDGEDFAPDYDVSKLPYGAESCGLYINGVAEWLMDKEEEGADNVD